jgi:hypothetical protein
MRDDPSLAMTVGRLFRWNQRDTAGPDAFD